MLRWLKAVLEWTFLRKSFIQLSLQAANHEGIPGDQRGGSDPRQGPRDFDSRVREPRWRRPSGGHTAVSVREPDDEAAAVVAVGGDASGPPKRRSGAEFDARRVGRHKAAY